MPKIFHVNWFRTNAAGKFLWPGFGDNIRVIDWMCKRVMGEDVADKTPIGYVPKPGKILALSLDFPFPSLVYYMAVSFVLDIPLFLTLPCPSCPLHANLFCPLYAPFFALLPCSCPYLCLYPLPLLLSPPLLSLFLYLFLSLPLFLFLSAPLLLRSLPLCLFH